MKRAPYWRVERFAGENDGAFFIRAGRIYFDAQQRENAEWWRRIGCGIDLRGLNVLDIGCGHGALSIDAAQRGAATVTGIDLDSSRIRFARRHLQEAYPALSATVRFLDEPADRLPREEAFDVVLSKDTFEHVQEPALLLEAVAQRLRPGGLLVCGFSPLYYSPNGDHSRYALPLPWLHAVLPQTLVFRWASRRLGRPVRSAADVGLNRLTLPEFERMLSADRWERLSLRVNPIVHPLRPAFDLLRRIRTLERFFTIGVYGVFRRRPPPAGCGSSRTGDGALPAANSDGVAAPGPHGRDGPEGAAP